MYQNQPTDKQKWYIPLFLVTCKCWRVRFLLQHCRKWTVADESPQRIYCVYIHQRHLSGPLFFKEFVYDTHSITAQRRRPEAAVYLTEVRLWIIYEVLVNNFKGKLFPFIFFLYTCLKELMNIQNSLFLYVSQIYENTWDRTDERFN